MIFFPKFAPSPNMIFFLKFAPSPNVASICCSAWRPQGFDGFCHLVASTSASDSMPEVAPVKIGF